MKSVDELAQLRGKVALPEKQMYSQTVSKVKQTFRLLNMKDDNVKIAFYTGFTTFSTSESIL